MYIETTSTGSQYSKIGNHHWSVSRLIELAKNLPVQEAPIDAINLDWCQHVTLRELATHVVQVNNADLQYPIILDEDGIIMDGRHRLIRAIIEEQKTIRFVRFDVNPSPCKDESDES